ncbi:MAG: protein kinase [bacterium]|nr:protein kinase [bacterium]
MSDAQSESLDDTRIEAILERWFEVEQAGEKPDLEELCDNDPELVRRVKAMIERQAALLGETPAGANTRSAERSPVLGVDRLGDYELKSRIGSGGMGDVYLARQISLDRMVAIKVLRRELADNPVRRLRFKREAQLTAALDHPNIVPIYGTGEDEGCVYLVMKLLGGVTLDRVDFAWTPRRTAEVATQVARALDATHAVGIVHRDIKPGNIQLDGEDAFVLDFGLARGRVDLTLTTAGQAPGTLAYMPPEQLRGDATAIDPRGDIYSLGVTMYQMLVGQPPFADESPEMLVRRALLHEAESIGLGSGDRDLETIIFRALEKDPARRFQTARKFAEDLERYLSGQPIKSRPPSALTRAVKLARRHRVKSAMLATALLISGAFGVQLWRDSQARAARLTRDFEQAASFLATRPAVALDRLGELADEPAAQADSRFEDLRQHAVSVLARDAILDRIQLDSLYQQTVLDDDLREQFANAHPAVRADSLTTVAHIFLAMHADDEAAMQRHLTDLDQKREFPRLRAALYAHVAAESPVAALAAAEPESTPDDHIFTAALILRADEPAHHAASEIAIAHRLAPDHARVRIMVGVGHLKVGDDQRARDVLDAVWHPDAPAPELHCVIGRLALRARDLDAAEAAFNRAERDLTRAGRAPIQRLAIARIELATERSDLDTARRLLGPARANFPNDEWFALAEARLRLAEEDLPAARAALVRASELAVIPWTRRRAKAGLLRVDAEQFVRKRGTLDVLKDEADEILSRANPILQEANAANDGPIQAAVSLSRFKIQARLAELCGAEDLPSERRGWREVAWQSLIDTLARDALNPFATAQLVSWMYAALIEKHESDDLLRLGDLVQQARSRAQKLTDRRFAAGEASPIGFQTAVFAAYLAEAVGAPGDCKHVGAIANAMFDELSEGHRQKLAGFARLLGQVRSRLGIAAWPDPSRR